MNGGERLYWVVESVNYGASDSNTREEERVVLVKLTVENDDELPSFS